MKRRNYYLSLLVSAMLGAIALTSCTSTDDNPVSDNNDTPTVEDILKNMEKIG